MLGMTLADFVDWRRRQRPQGSTFQAPQPPGWGSQQPQNGGPFQTWDNSAVMNYPFQKPDPIPFGNDAPQWPTTKGQGPFDPNGVPDPRRGPFDPNGIPDPRRGYGPFDPNGIPGPKQSPSANLDPWAFDPPQGWPGYDPKRQK